MRAIEPEQLISAVIPMRPVTLRALDLFSTTYEKL
jgi:hypothetical protein